MHKHTCSALLSAFQNTVDMVRDAEISYIQRGDSYDEGLMRQGLRTNFWDLMRMADEYIRDDMDKCTCGEAKLAAAMSRD